MTLNDFIEEMVYDLIGEIQKVNPIHLMNILNHNLIFSIDPSSSLEKLPNDFVAKFHYINGLLVSKPFDESVNYADINEHYDSIIEKTDNIFKAHVFSLLSNYKERYKSKKLSKNEKLDLESGFAYLVALHQLKLGSSDQFLEYTIERFKAFDEIYFIPYKGFSTLQFVTLIKAVTKTIIDQYQKVVDEFRELLNPFMEDWNLFRNDEMSFEDIKQRAPKGRKLDNINMRLKEIAEGDLKSFIVIKDDFATEFPLNVINAIFDFFSFDPGKINKNYLYPDDFNELTIKSFLKIDDQRYYITGLNYNIWRAIPSSLENALVNSHLANRYFKHRDKVVQARSAGCFQNLFPPENIMQEAHYLEYETDVLIPFGRTLLICEIKSKALRDIMQTKGNLKKAKSDFKKSIQKAYEQAIRARNSIMDEGKIIFRNSKKQKLCEINKEDYDEFLLLIITDESYGIWATNLTLLLDKRKSDPFPFVISLFDLELFLSLINTPEMLFEYIKQRERIHGKVISHDELDYAGYFLKHGNLDFDDMLKRTDTVTLDSSYSDIFDHEFYKSHGFKIKEEDYSDGPFITSIKRRGNKVTMGIEGLPDTFETILIDEPKESPMRPIKKIRTGRNDPCPCGSNKKFKRCCGKV